MECPHFKHIRDASSHSSFASSPHVIPVSNYQNPVTDLLLCSRLAFAYDTLKAVSRTSQVGRSLEILKIGYHGCVSKTSLPAPRSMSQAPRYSTGLLCLSFQRTSITVQNKSIIRACSRPSAHPTRYTAHHLPSSVRSKTSFGRCTTP